MSKSNSYIFNSASYPKNIYIDGLGNVILRSYEGRRQALLKDSSFNICGFGKNDVLALEDLKKVKEKLINKLENND